MIVFRIDDMTCGHCASTVTRAVKDVDRDAEVRVNLADHLVQIESRVSNEEALRAAIAEAGYTPVVQQARQ